MKRLEFFFKKNIIIVLLMVILVFFNYDIVVIVGKLPFFRQSQTYENFNLTMQ